MSSTWIIVIVVAISFAILFVSFLSGWYRGKEEYRTRARIEQLREVK